MQEVFQMNRVEIKKDIFWVGSVDWNIRSFHGHTYATKRGTTYNAYLIIDEKVVLVDTVGAPFLDELRESGEINMFGAAPYLSDAFDLSEQEARKVLTYWMQTFGTRKDKG